MNGDSSEGLQESDFGAMTRGEALRLGGALALGAALALPLGIMLGGGAESDPPAPATAGPAAATRNPYSPRILSDPAFLARQRENVEALEVHCRQTGAMCAEARAGRRRIGDEQHAKPF